VKKILSACICAAALIAAIHTAEAGDIVEELWTEVVFLEQTSMVTFVLGDTNGSPEMSWHLVIGTNIVMTSAPSNMATTNLLFNWGVSNRISIAPANLTNEPGKFDYLFTIDGGTNSLTNALYTLNDPEGVLGDRYVHGSNVYNPTNKYISHVVRPQMTETNIHGGG